MTAPVLNDLEEPHQAGRPALTFDDIVPPEIRVLARRYLLPCLPFVPGEYLDVRVGWDDTDQRASLKTMSTPQYRYAKVTFCPAFLTQCERERRDAAMHEIVHVVIDPLWQSNGSAISFLRATLEEPEEAKTGPCAMLSEERRRAVELVTCDLTRHFLRLIPESIWSEG